MESRNECSQSALAAYAEKYVWWKIPTEAIRHPYRVIAQVMNLGEYDDMRGLFASVGEEALKETLARAEAGWFNERSWHWWHYRLGLSEYGNVPALPQRRLDV